MNNAFSEKQHSCLQVVGSVHALSGGPSRAIPGLCDAVASRGYKVTLLTQRYAEEKVDDIFQPKHPDVEDRFVPAVKRFGNPFTRGYGRYLADLVSGGRFSVVHSNGMWVQCNYHAAAVSRKLRVPHLIAPHGMLEPWAFRHNAWKKLPLWLVWQKRALQDATALIAESDQEVEHMRQLGLRPPIGMIPYGMDFYGPGSPRRFRQGEDRVLLFLSRIHPKNGLRELVRARSAVRPAGWNVVIAGPDEGGHRAEVEAEIRSLGLGQDFRFAGSVEGAEKERLYREASVFILPTHSENFGIVVPEALSAGTPVITTKGAPWAELVTHRCGWWIDLGVEPLIGALRAATSLSDEEREEMGRRGREFVLERFGWEQIGRKMAVFYDWAINGGSAPDFVHFR
jgi:glycosyltransferase involved in cell wall biosynthesis